MYLRLDPAPEWFDVERALDILGYDDTEAGRRQFDEFVMEVDFDDRPLEWQRDSMESITVASGPRPLDWELLIGLARAATSLSEDVPLWSRRRNAVRLRLIVALVATRDFGWSCAATASHLGITPGALSNLLVRSANRPELVELLKEVRRGLAATVRKTT